MDWALRIASVTDEGIGWKPREAGVGKLSAANSKPCVKLTRAFSRLPAQTSPFSFKCLSGKLRCPPPGKSSSCSSAQQMAHPTRKISTSFLVLFIALFHSQWEKQFYPTSSIFKHKQATVNASCHCWGLCTLYVWNHKPWLVVAISSHYVTILCRRWCFKYSPHLTVDKHLGSAALQSQQAKTLRIPFSLSSSFIPNIKIILRSKMQMSH